MGGKTPYNTKNTIWYQFSFPAPKPKGSPELGRAAQYQCFPIDSISIIQFVLLSIPISIILKRAYQYQYFINYSKNSLINFNINTPYQYLLMILLRLPISNQLVNVININAISIIRIFSYQFQFQYQYCHFCLSIFPYQCIEQLCFPFGHEYYGQYFAQSDQ